MLSEYMVILVDF